jgi:hypothetical protein
MAVTKTQAQALLDQARAKLAEYVTRDETARAQIAARATRRLQVEMLVVSLEQLVASIDAPIDLDPSP